MTDGTKTKRLAVAVCLDETGSMLPNRGVTIKGFNDYVDGLGEQEGETVVSLTLFSDTIGEPKFRPRHQQAPLTHVRRLTDETYAPRGNTPLLDAIGHTVKELASWVEAQTDDPTVLVVIQTDGYENASTDYTREQIQALIREREESGWRFIYLGADQDAFTAERAATAMGMAAGSSFNYVGSTSDSAFSGLRSATATRRADPTATSAQLADEVRATYQEAEAAKQDETT